MASKTNHTKVVLNIMLKFLGIGLIAIIVGIILGFTIAGGNPIDLFIPATWEHIANFLK